MNKTLRTCWTSVRTGHGSLRSSHRQASRLMKGGLQNLLKASSIKHHIKHQ